MVLWAGVLTHSAVGVGTVVGSELFNLLCIIGAVCLVTPRPLQMDWRPLSREVSLANNSPPIVLSFPSNCVAIHLQLC